MSLFGFHGLANATPRGKQPPRRIAAPRALSADGIGRPDPSACKPKNKLTYHGGKLVSNPDIFLLFWGPKWNTDPAQIAAKAQLVSFYQNVGTSDYACAWREYAVAGHPLNAGTYNGSYVIPSTPSTPLADADIQAEIQNQITLGNAPPRSDDRFYAVVPQKNIVIDGGDGTTGCGGSNFQFCGYHSSFGTASAPFRYTAIPYPCNSGNGTCFQDPTDDPGMALQHVASHELAETVTDPDDGSTGDPGWFSDKDGQENADICAADACNDNLTVGVNTYLVNPNYSNLAKGCITSTPCSVAPDCTDAAPGLCTPGKSRASQCAFEWQVNPNLTQRRNMPSGKVTCTDGQTFCDADGAVNGSCSFHVAACLNSTDPRLATCGTFPIDTIQLSKPRFDSFDGTDASNAATLLNALKNADPGSPGTIGGGAVSYSPPAQTADSCTSFVDLVVPVGKRAFSVKLQSAAGKASGQLKLICTR